MPFNFNFNNALTSIKTVEVYPNGWITPLTIEYCSAQARPYDTMTSVCWRIKGTEHTFTIYENRLNKISSGDYAKHFTETLELFREDYLSWFTAKDYEGCAWRDEYKQQFSKLIVE